jgi:type IV pilus assembly protein PilN
MIRINLLPVPKARKVKKQSEMRSQYVLGGLVLVIVAIFCGYSWYDLNKRVNNLETKKAKANQELKELKEKVKEVESYEENKKNLQEKNAIIEQLRKNQSGPVHILDEISTGVESLKLWLDSLNVKGNSVDLSGKAITNADIVEFVDRLKKSRYFSNVTLLESRQVVEDGISIYQFKIKSTVVL